MRGGGTGGGGTCGGGERGDGACGGGASSDCTVADGTGGDGTLATISTTADALVVCTSNVVAITACELLVCSSAVVALTADALVVCSSAVVGTTTGAARLWLSSVAVTLFGLPTVVPTGATLRFCSMAILPSRPRLSARAGTWLRPRLSAAHVCGRAAGAIGGSGAALTASGVTCSTAALTAALHTSALDTPSVEVVGLCCCASNTKLVTCSRAWHAASRAISASSETGAPSFDAVAGGPLGVADVLSSATASARASAPPSSMIVGPSVGKETVVKKSSRGNQISSPQPVHPCFTAPHTPWRRHSPLSLRLSESLSLSHTPHRRTDFSTRGSRRIPNAARVPRACARLVRVGGDDGGGDAGAGGQLIRQVRELLRGADRQWALTRQKRLRRRVQHIIIDFGVGV